MNRRKAFVKAKRSTLKSKSSSRPKAASIVKVVVLTAVIVSFATLLFQVHVLDNHILGPSSSHFAGLSNPEGMKASNPHTKKTRSKSITVSSDTRIDDADADGEDGDSKPILEILSEAGYDVTESSKDIDRSVLPKWSEILRGYGPPKILGLESCKVFRDTVASDKRHLAVAGLFNSGTNLLSALISQNCQYNGKNIENQWQVPWGKHIPFYNRTNHVTYGKTNLRYDEVMPIVTIRDPYTWLKSMCRQPYAVQYDFAKSSCPNLIPYPSDIEAHPRYKRFKYMPVFVKFDSKLPKVRYESIGHLWNNWYQSYLQFKGDDGRQTDRVTTKTPTAPFVMVRMEDLVFHAKTVVPQLCECIGGSMKRDRVRYVSEIQNVNSGIDTSTGSGLLRSIVNYGNITKRRDNYPAVQLEAVKEILDSRIMDLLGYSYEEP